MATLREVMEKIPFLRAVEEAAYPRQYADPKDLKQRIQDYQKQMADTYASSPPIMTFSGDDGFSLHTASAYFTEPGDEGMNAAYEGYYRREGDTIVLYNPETHEVRRSLVIEDLGDRTPEEARAHRKALEEIEPWTPPLKASDPIGL